MADLTIAGTLNANGSVEIRPVKANRLIGDRLVPPVAVPATPSFSVKVPDVPGIVYRVRAFNAAGRPGGQAFTSKSVAAMALDVPPVVTGGGNGGGGGGGPAYDDTALKARVAAVEAGKLDKAEAEKQYTPLEAAKLMGGRIDQVEIKASSGAEALAKVQNLEQEPFLKGLVLGPDDPVPPGTPSGYVIVRKSE